MENGAISLLRLFIDFYSVLLLIRFLLQLVQADFFNPVSQVILKVTAPVVEPLTRIIPTIKNFNRFDGEALCIYGGKSNYVKEDYFKIFKIFFSKIFFHEIKDADHFLHIENPLEFYDASNKFLNN